MRVVSYPEHAVPPDLRRQVILLQDQAWPSDGPHDVAPWHDPALLPRSVLLVRDDDRVLSALDILSKDVEHEGQTYAARGISAMVTDLELRGRGHGRALARAARELMSADGADVGLFTCDRPLRRFYESAGWRCLPGTVVVGGSPDRPVASDRFDKVTMASFFTERAVRASSGFVGARIRLHSGHIDTLW